MANGKKIYTESDFNKADTAQRLQIANVQPEFAMLLSNFDYEYLRILRLVYPVLLAPIGLREKMQRVRVLAGLAILREKRIVDIMNDAQILFLNSATIPPNLLRGAMNEDLFGNVEFLKAIRNNTELEPKDRINAATAITKTWVEIAKHNPINEPEKEALPTEFAYSADADLENEILNENTIHEPTDSPNQGVQ